MQGLTAYPISQGRLLNVSALHAYRDKARTKYAGKLIVERTKEELAKDYEGWEDEVTQLLQVRYILLVQARQMY